MHVYHGMADYQEFEKQVLEALDIRMSHELAQELLTARADSMSREALAVVARAFRRYMADKDTLQ